MTEIIFGIIAIIITVGVYAAMVPIHKKINTPFTQPIIAVSVIIIILLLVFNIPYETYQLGGAWIDFLMGPAVVALALPLYNHFERLKKLAVPILSGVTAGSFIGVSTGLLFTKLFGFERELILSIVPKSVTTPVAVSIAESLEGSMSLAAVFVVIAGVSGVLMSPLIFKLFKLSSPIGRGIGLGSASHAMGTANSMGRSELEGSISTIAMVICAVIVSVIAPILVIIML